MTKQKKSFTNLILLAVCTFSLISCNSEKNSKINTDVIKIATTTSLYNSGLLDALEEEFEKNTNKNIEYIVVGSGAAMELGKSGEVDGIFVHSKEAEQILVEKEISLGRNPIMYNYFQIVGIEPLQSTTFENVLDEIRKDKIFVSRADNSGTNVKELKMWGNSLPTNYVETGKGMLDTLIITSEKEGYTLTDDATFITNSDKFELVEVYKNDDFFKNEYSYHMINPALNEYINSAGSSLFLEYLKSEETLQFIADYGVDQYGKSLYTLSE